MPIVRKDLKYFLSFLTAQTARSTAATSGTAVQALPGRMGLIKTNIDRT